MRRFWLLSVFVFLTGATAIAQDPVKVYPKHYKVNFKNAQARVLRIHYGPHEEGAMHEHPARVVVLLTDSHVRHTLPDGKMEERQGKAGDVRWVAGEKHLAENLSDRPFEATRVEVEAKPAEAQPARMSSRLTLLVFKDNSISAVTDYWVEDGVLYYPSSNGGEIAVPLERVDLGMTVQLNRERGLKFALREKPSAESGTVRVTSNPQGADIRVDGAFFGNAPATLKLSPVKHTIRVSLAGYKDWSREVSVRAGSELELTTVFVKR